MTHGPHPHWSEDVCAKNHGGNPESIAAYYTTNLARNERLIIELLEIVGQTGATCDELEIGLGMSHQTVSSRCSDLLRRGIIRRKPDPRHLGKYIRRETRTGCKAAVLVLV